MSAVLIYGAGMLGRQVACLVRAHFAAQHDLLGFVDDVQPAGKVIFEDRRVIGGLAAVARDPVFAPGRVRLVFAIGYGDMLARGRAFAQAAQCGYEFVTLVHPGAHVEASVRLGRGVVVLAGAILDHHVAIGDASYVHIGAKMGEDCAVGTNNYFSAGSTLGGSVVVGDDNFFGINCTVVNDLTIGSHNFMNAAALVYRPVGDNVRVVEYREQRDVAMPARRA